jgi:16S rRNA (guanine1207-N2)-methyltransferase
VEAAIKAGSAQFLDSLQLWTQPGVFSWDRIDVGSALLVEQLPEFIGRGADLGGGIGFLSRAVLKSRKVTEFSLIEIDRRAVEAAKKNLGETRCRFLHVDLRNAETGLKNLDFVVTNPPFHDGGIEDQSLGKVFLEKASLMLKAGGVCWLVANRHLPYEVVLKSVFSQVRPVVEKNGFKVYEAKK